MRNAASNQFSRLLCVLAMIGTMVPPAFGQQAPATPAAPAPAASSSPNKPPLKPEELEQLLAPLALYPDSLITQMFMASTYPLEIVEADRWAKAHADLKGDALAKELEKQTWDPSVRSLVNFPQVLAMMSEKLDLTVKIGDAFIGQQADVLNTVQKLRAKAQAQGNLKSNEQQKVTVEPAPAPAPANTTVVVQQPAPTQVITIEPAQPTVVYVPAYDPVVVYGAWPYPTYPPYPYYPPRPPGWVAGAVGFGIGVACGAAWGYAWGHCNWGHGDIDIDINRNTNFNTNINRNNFQNNINRNNTNIGGRAGTWQHDPSHRQGVAYRDQKANQQFGGANRSADAVKAREDFRGRADAGRQDLARGGADQFRANNNALGGNGGGVQNRASDLGQNRGGNLSQDRANNLGQNRGSSGGQLNSFDRPSAGNLDRSSPAVQNRSSGAGQTRDTSGVRSGAFNGADRGGTQTRAASQRGQTSRAAPARASGGRARR